MTGVPAKTGINGWDYFETFQFNAFVQIEDSRRQQRVPSVSGCPEIEMSVDEALPPQK